MRISDWSSDVCSSDLRGRADLAAIGLVAAVADQIDAEFALRAFGGDIDFARGDVETLGIELEVMAQRFHRLLHLGALWRNDLAVKAGDRAGRPGAQTMVEDLRSAEGRSGKEGVSWCRLGRSAEL